MKQLTYFNHANGFFIHKKAVILMALFSLFLFKNNLAWSQGDFNDTIGANQAFEYLNQIRADLSLSPLLQNDTLTESATNHARYCTLNNQQGHHEKNRYPYFTGNKPNARTDALGYQAGVSEVVSYNSKPPEKFIDDLMSAIYHRIGLLDMTKNEVGIGIVRKNSGKISSTLVANMGNFDFNYACLTQQTHAGGTVIYQGVCNNKTTLSQANFDELNQQTAVRNPKVVMWPRPGGRVQPVFYEEQPDPLPNCNVSGYPVHIQINPLHWGKLAFVKDSFKLTKLTDAGVLGKPVKSITAFTNQTDPNHHDSDPEFEKWYAYFPHLRLDWNSRYQAEVSLIHLDSGETQTRKWRFVTPNLPNLTVVKHKKISLHARPNETLSLYFPPTSCRASMSTHLNSKYTQGMTFNTEFVDTQTLTVKLGAQKGKIIFNYKPTQTQVTILVR